MPLKMLEESREPAERGEPKLKTAQLVTEANIARLLTEEQLATIGGDVVAGYRKDRSSRAEWEVRNADAMKLALQVDEAKTFPWENCANVKFPLVTVAALQFLSRVAILTKGRQIVKCDVIGPDPDGHETARAARISAHMSYQLVEEDTEWINDDEKVKLSASIMGCAFKKSYFDQVAGINISEQVQAANFVVDYNTKRLDKATRMTHVMLMSPNDIQERVRRGVFLELKSDSSSTPEISVLQAAADESQGTQSSADSESYEILEQHCYLDLDDDDYAEPYIVFVRADTAEVLRIVARYYNEGDVFRVNDAAVRRLRSLAQTTESAAAKVEYLKAADKLETASDNHIVRITPQLFFTKYTFIPSPDGGFYDLGFGALLGPVNEAVNSLINQQLDAGTMQVTAGGFLGRGVKIKGGKNSFDPFEWKPVDSTGDDLRKSIVPLPVNAPSSVLFQLLGVLISYGEKISGATDIMTGVSPGQNTPAETSRNTIEQGMKLFSGIYARMHRSFKEELAKLYVLNQLYLESSAQFVLLSSGDGALITQNDYKKGLIKVVPAADVAVVSESQRQQKAQMVMQAAMSTPGFNTYLATKQWLEAFDVAGVEQLYPDPKGKNAIPPAPNQKLELEKQKLELQKAEQDMTFRLAVVELQQDADLNAAKISQLSAQAQKLLAEADGVDVGHQIAMINAQLGAAKAHQEGMAKAISIMQKTVDQKQKQQVIDHSQTQKSAQPEGTSNDTGTANSTGQNSAPEPGASGMGSASSDTASAPRTA